MKNYEEPIIKLVEVKKENIICSSSTLGGGDLGDGDVIPATNINQ